MRHFTKFYFVLLMVIMGISVQSCKKDSTTTAYTCSSCATTPEAVAANDNTSKGIYKGIVVGSSGTIKFDVANTGSAITATMIIDGTTVTLTSNVTWSAGQAFVSAFTGTMNGQPVSITFAVDVNGSNPTVSSVNIPGHPYAVFSVAKETSNGQIYCFEGSFKGTSTGTLNLMMSTTLGLWGGKAKDDADPTNPSSFSGTIANNQLTGNGVTATLTGDVIDGNWTDGKGGSGTWTAKKTL